MVLAAGVWAGNRWRGLSICRDPTVPDHRADAPLSANRCHDNAEARILFFSATGRAEGNACWGNGKHGIALPCYSATAPSDAMLTGNRCFANQEAGIALHSSRALTTDNRCRQNGIGDRIHLGEQSLPLFPGGPEQPLGPAHLDGEDCKQGLPPDLPGFEQSRIEAHSDGLLVRALDAAGIDRPEALAYFLGSGCRHCFLRVWSGARVVADRPAPDEPAAAPPSGPAGGRCPGRSARSGRCGQGRRCGCG